jgi:hypothetical protein
MTAVPHRTRGFAHQPKRREERMEPKKLYGAAATTKYNRLPETYQQRMVREAMWQGLGLKPKELGERVTPRPGYR